MLVVLVLVAAAPGALAGQPFAASLQVYDQPTLEGAARIGSQDALLDLRPAVDAGEPVRIAWTAAEGYRVSATTYTAGPGSPVPTTLRWDRDNHSVAYGAGSLHDIGCGATRCEVVLFDVDGSSILGMTGRARGPLGWLDAAESHWGGISEPGYLDAFYVEAPPGAFGASGARATESALVLESARPSVEGRVGLLLVGVSAALTRPDGVERIDLVQDREEVEAPLGLGVLRYTQASFMVLYLDEARVEAPAGTAAVLRASDPTITVDGRVASADASGVLRSGGEERGFKRTSFAVAGEFELDLRASTEEQALASLDPGVRVSADASGDARTVRIGGAPIHAGTDAGHAAALAALALLLAAAAFLPFYTRLDARRLVENDNRRRILDALRAEPGLHADDLARRLGLARVVVQHHLRHLERHHFIVPHRSGRARCYFLADALRPLRFAEIHIALRDERTRVLVRVLADSETPLTQNDLTARTGLPQRTVSYHLARLAAASAVGVHGSHPRRYSPTEELRECLPSAGPAVVAPGLARG